MESSEIPPEPSHEAILGLPEQHGFDQSWVAAMRKVHDVLHTKGIVTKEGYAFTLRDEATLRFLPLRDEIAYHDTDGSKISIVSPLQVHANLNRDGVNIYTGEEHAYTSIAINRSGLLQVHTCLIDPLREAQPIYAPDPPQQGRIAIAFLRPENVAPSHTEISLPDNPISWENISTLRGPSELTVFGDQSYAVTAPSGEIVLVNPTGKSVQYRSKYISAVLPDINQIYPNLARGVFLRTTDTTRGEKTLLLDIHGADSLSIRSLSAQNAPKGSEYS